MINEPLLDLQITIFLIIGAVLFVFVRLKMPDLKYYLPSYLFFTLGYFIYYLHYINSIYRLIGNLIFIISSLLFLIGTILEYSHIFKNTEKGDKKLALVLLSPTVILLVGIQIILMCFMLLSIFLLLKIFKKTKTPRHMALILFQVSGMLSVLSTVLDNFQVTGAWEFSYLSIIIFATLFLTIPIVAYFEQLLVESGERLKESEEKYRYLFQLSPNMILLIDPYGTITSVNSPFLTYFGYNRDELIGKDFRNVEKFDPKNIALYQKIFEDVLSGGVFEPLEFQAFDRFNEEKWIEIRASLIEIGNRKMIQIIIQDVNERKRVELALKDSEERYRLIIENSGDVIWTTDMNLNLTYVSPNSPKILGYTIEESMSLPIDIRVTPESMKKMADILKDEFKLERKKDKDLTRSRTYETDQIHKNGSIIPVEITFTFLHDADGKATGIIGISRDITERKKAEERLKESKKKFQYLYEFEKLISQLLIDFINTPNEKLDDLIDQTLEKIAQYVNAVRSSLFICSENLTRITNTNEWCADPNDSQIDLLQNVPFESFGYYKELLKAKKDVIISRIDDLPAEAIGEREWINQYGFRSLLFVPMINNNELYGTIGFYGEINTELEWSKDYLSLLKIFANIIVNTMVRKQVEANLKESEERYRKAYEQATFYKELLSHDIRNIFQVVNSSAELMSFDLNGTESPIDISSLSDTIKTQVMRGTRLISNVHKLSELDNTEISLSEIEALHLLESAFNSVKRSYQEKNINIQLESASKEYYVLANDLLEDVFENLLINAVKYNTSETIEISIKISKLLRDKEPFVKMEFMDNGIGVDDRRKKLIFQRGNREYKGTKGMGLGLSLVTKILESYNGEIWVEDKVKGDHSKGSNFVIVVPEAV